MRAARAAAAELLADHRPHFGYGCTCGWEYRGPLNPDDPIAMVWADRSVHLATVLSEAGLLGADLAPVDRPCTRCEGCGRVADSDDGEPWTAWEQLPPGSDVAVRLGLVRPLSCPECSGTGRVPGGVR